MTERDPLCVGPNPPRGQCWRPVVADPAGIPVCDRHLESLTICLATTRPALGRSHAALGSVPGAAKGQGVVYYLGDPARQRVKIGTSTVLRRRIQTLRKNFPGIRVLATEPGTYPLEALRHEEFADLREDGEWFRKTPRLMTHVNAVRSKHGILCLDGDPVPTKWVAAVRARERDAA